MNDKLQTFINFFVRNNQLKNYLFFFIISILLWSLTNLSQEYRYWVNIPIDYSHLPDGILHENLPNDTLHVELMASGYQIIKLKMQQPTLKIDVKMSGLIASKRFITKDYLNEINNIIGEENNVLRIIPAKINFELNEIRKKRVKILPNITIDYQLGYKNKKNIQISPDSLWVFGLSKDLKKFERVYTESISLTNVSKDVEGDVMLVLPKNIKSNIKKVKYQLSVDQFIELQSKVNFELINAPNGTNIVLFPKKSIVKYSVFKSDYQKVKDIKMRVLLDFNQRDSVLYPKLVNTNNKIFDIRIHPDKVAFLIKNK